MITFTFGGHQQTPYWHATLSVTSLLSTLSVLKESKTLTDATSSAVSILFFFKRLKMEDENKPVPFLCLHVCWMAAKCV